MAAKNRQCRLLPTANPVRATASPDDRTGCRSSCPGQEATPVIGRGATAPRRRVAPHRQRTLTPDQIIAGSSQKVWWNCDADPDHELQAQVKKRSSVGQGCHSCAETGYDARKPGWIYLLCEEHWGKVGISNVLEKRLAKHAQGGVFGTLVDSVAFDDGALPVDIEDHLCAFIAELTDERAPRTTDAYTESSSAQSLPQIHDGFRRLVGR